MDFSSLGALGQFGAFGAVMILAVVICFWLIRQFVKWSRSEQMRNNELQTEQLKVLVASQETAAKTTQALDGLNQNIAAEGERTRNAIKASEDAIVKEIRKDVDRKRKRKAKTTNA